MLTSMQQIHQSWEAPQQCSSMRHLLVVGQVQDVQAGVCLGQKEQCGGLTAPRKGEDTVEDALQWPAVRQHRASPSNAAAALPGPICCILDGELYGGLYDLDLLRCQRVAVGQHQPPGGIGQAAAEPPAAAASGTRRRGVLHVIAAFLTDAAAGGRQLRAGEEGLKGVDLLKELQG